MENIPLAPSVTPMLSLTENGRTTAGNAAILFEPDAYSLASPTLKGRQAAGNGFLRGYARYAQVDTFFGWVNHPKAGEGYEAAIRDAGRTEPCQINNTQQTDWLARVGCLYRPDPALGTHAWARGWSGHRAWSLCGIAHTTASAGVMETIADWLIAPLQSWDAVICTSQAVRAMIISVLQAQREYLHARLGATRLPIPQLPVIPLGVACEDFRHSPEQRGEARARLGLSPQTIVVLFVGRLSFHSKAHPLAMYQAIERAARGHEVVVIECGWYANTAIAQAYKEAANFACPSVRVIHLDGRVHEQRDVAWAAADLFCSLSDNLQETFGLTPLEAMAAGLPVVVSDWDGYRDTVRDGVDGFCIPTLMPEPGFGHDLAQRFALGVDNYDRYCGYTSQLVAVDIEAASQALRRLFANPALRRQMGMAGARRAREVFDWSMIIPRYQALWAELAARRGQGNALPAETHAWPAHMDPFRIFVGYPTEALTAQSRLRLVETDPMTQLARLRQLTMVSFALPMVPTEPECHKIFAQFDTQSVGTAAQLVSVVPAADQGRLLRGLVWLVKLGLLAIVR